MKNVDSLYVPREKGQKKYGMLYLISVTRQTEIKVTLDYHMFQFKI